MNNNPESRALLNKNTYREQDDNSSVEEWSDSSCSYSDTERYFCQIKNLINILNNILFSSIAEWENLIDDYGELLYIDCHPHVTTQPPKEEINISQNDSIFTRSTTRRSTRGIYHVKFYS